MSESFVITRADGVERKISGYMYAAPNPNTKQYQASAKKLPAKVDLRQYMTAVENQGAASSCTANAVAGAYEYLAKRHTGNDYDVSRLFIYYNARALKDEENIQDSGSYISLAIEGLKQYGACSEATWDYILENVNEAPEEQAYEEAANFVVEDMEVVPVHLNAWKACLADGYPIIFGMLLFGSFDKQRKKGVVPMPTPKETQRGQHGAHAMLCVGYSDKDRVFIVRNSWGEEWGDNGYCYIPYDYIVNPKYNLGDCWRIRQLENVDFDQSTWSDDDESVLGDYDSELANMSDEDYTEFLDAMGDIPLEYRIGLLFLHAANADNEISEDELEALSAYMDQTLDKLGSEFEAGKVLKYCMKSLDDEDLLKETIQIFSDYLSSEMLGKMLNDLQTVIGADEISEDEQQFLNTLTSVWQLGDSQESEEEENDSDDDEDEDEKESDDESSEGSKDDEDDEEDDK